MNNMDPEPREMEKVRRIIALKRYEQPPPGYFHLLPNRILNRIEKGDGKSSFWENWFSQFTIRPALAYAFGLTVCGAVTLGLVYSPGNALSASTSASLPSSESAWAVASAGMTLASETGPARVLHVPDWLGSTNPVTPPHATASLFETTDARVVPVSFYRDE